MSTARSNSNRSSTANGRTRAAGGGTGTLRLASGSPKLEPTRFPVISGVRKFGLFAGVGLGSVSRSSSSGTYHSSKVVVPLRQDLHEQPGPHPIEPSVDSSSPIRTYAIQSPSPRHRLGGLNRDSLCQSLSFF